MLVIAGPTASGKSVLALELADVFDGTVINADSRQIYRDLRVLTARPDATAEERAPHRLYGFLDAAERGSVADWRTLALDEVGAATRAGRLPILVGGTGLYFRALTRGLFPGPGRDAALRGRLESIAGRRGAAFLHRMLRRVDPPSALRIQPRDLKRMIRALEVYFLTGRPLTAHFAETRSPIPDVDVVAIALRLPAGETADRVNRRVDEQFERGLLDEIRTLLARGIPETARPFGGLVYRQALEHLRGVRDEASTRALIAQENRRYARRQLIWFRKEPNLTWFDGPGSSPATIDRVTTFVDERLQFHSAGPIPPDTHHAR